MMEQQSEQDVQEQEPFIPQIPEHTKQATIAMLSLLFYSTLMFTLPFASFYGTKHYLMEFLKIHDIFVVNAWSVFSAVITVNAIIFLYAYKAYHETEYDDEGNELNSDGTVKEIKQD